MLSFLYSCEAHSMIALWRLQGEGSLDYPSWWISMKVSDYNEVCVARWIRSIQYCCWSQRWIYLVYEGHRSPFICHFLGTSCFSSSWWVIQYNQTHNFNLDYPLNIKPHLVSHLIHKDKWFFVASPKISDIEESIMFY